MRQRVLATAGLGLLLIQGIVSAQQATTEPPREDREVRVVNVQYYPVGELAELLRQLSGDREIGVFFKESDNRLILQARPDHMQEILRLIAQLDVRDMSARDAQFLACRIYMLEVPAKGAALKPFAMVLGMVKPPSSLQMLDALKGDDLQIGRLFAGEGEPDERIVIQGRAASNEAIKRIAQSIPESRIEELAWDNETIPADIPAAQIGQLPESLQQHLRKFLGTEVRTVGYWFGNVSFPGAVAASMGPWTFEMETRPAQSADLNVQVRVRQEPPMSHGSSIDVLDNSLQGRIGRPIIIGYSRDSYGTRTMGAMVILLEADAAGKDAP